MRRSWLKRTTPLPQKAISDKWYSSTVEQLSLPGVEEHLKKHPLQPHQMSRAQYEADPQTMWRAEGSDTLGGSSTGYLSSGLHFGEYGAARERGAQLANFHDTTDFGPAPRPIRMFSLRTKGRFSNEPTAHPAAEVLPQTKGVWPDDDVGGSAWPQYRTGRWYANEVEGSGAFINASTGEWNYHDILSGYVPRREGFLTTHSEEVLQAHAEGKSVHPAILQQAQIGPEYSETIEPAKPVDHKEGVRTLERPEHPAKLFQTINPHAGKGEKIDIPTRGGGVIEHSIRHDHALHITNEDYDEGMRKMKEGSSEPIWGHIGEPRPAGSPR